MYSVFRKHKITFAIVFSSFLFSLSACGKTEDGSAVFIKANPEVNAVMDYPPRTLRVFLTELPDIDNSSMQLTGPNGEVALTRFHTMGANDLMVEIEDYPLPDGEYTVEWTAQFVDGEKRYSGDYQFTVATPE